MCTQVLHAFLVRGNFRDYFAFAVTSPSLEVPFCHGLSLDVWPYGAHAARTKLAEKLKTAAPNMTHFFLLTYPATLSGGLWVVFLLVKITWNLKTNAGTHQTKQASCWSQNWSFCANLRIGLEGRSWMAKNFQLTKKKNLEHLLPMNEMKAFLKFIWNNAAHYCKRFLCWKCH